MDIVKAARKHPSLEDTRGLDQIEFTAQPVLKTHFTFTVMVRRETFNLRWIRWVSRMEKIAALQGQHIVSTGVVHPDQLKHCRDSIPEIQALLVAIEASADPKLETSTVAVPKGRLRKGVVKFTEDKSKNSAAVVSYSSTLGATISQAISGSHAPVSINDVATKNTIIKTKNAKEVSKTKAANDSE